MAANPQQGVSPQIQQQYAMYQQIQQQLQQISSQKMQYEMTVREMKRAIEELSSVRDGAAVYSSIGTVMMQKDRDSVRDDLSERVDSLQLRISSLEKQEKMMGEKASQLQTQIESALGTAGAAPKAE